MRRFITIVLMLLTVGYAYGKGRCVDVISLNGANIVSLDWRTGELYWSAKSNGVEVVAPSRLAMITDRDVWGDRLRRAKVNAISGDLYSGALVDFGDFCVELRAYDEGVAYRFLSQVKGEYKVIDEIAEFSFAGDDMAYIPYVNFRPDATSDYATQYETSFENIYTYTAIAEIDWRRLIFAPVVVERNGLKLWISEANLEDYPGMFFSNRNGDGLLDTEFAPRPKEVERCTFVIIASFFLYYLVYMFVPVAGPQFYFPVIGEEAAVSGIYPEIGNYFNLHPDITIAQEGKGWLFTELVGMAQSTGERPTAAFPSSHIGITAILVILAYRANKKLFAFMFPVFVLLCCATVYIKAHYLVDAIAGLITGVAVYCFTTWLYKRFLRE